MVTRCSIESKPLISKFCMPTTWKLKPFPTGTAFEVTLDKFLYNGPAKVVRDTPGLGF